MTVSLANIKELQSDRVIMRDKQYVEETLNSIVRDGLHNLQVVSDFDFTITKHTLPDGKPALSSFCLFEQCPSVPDSYKEETRKMLSFYKPIEIDPSVPLEEKCKYMVEWYSRTRQLLRGFSFDNSELLQIAHEYKHSFRDSCHSLLKYLHDNNVPCLVFSAGLGDSVNAMLTASNINYPNIKVISNFLKITNGIVDGLRGDIIHVLNKNETAIKDTEYYETVKNRQNVILMGDSLGDCSMAEGMPNTKAILKIGFLCNNVEINLQNYMNSYDIVLINDQTMNVPRALLSLL